MVEFKRSFSAGIVALSLCGCTGLRVELVGDVSPAPMGYTAVLDFAQAPIETEVNNRWLLWVSVLNRRAGADAAEVTADLLKERKMARVCDCIALRALLRQRKIAPCDLAARLDPAKLQNLLGVDAVVVGEIHKFGYRYVFPGYQRSFVSVSVRCVDLRTRKVAWSFSGQAAKRWTPPLVVAREVLDRGLREVQSRRAAASVDKLRGAANAPPRALD